MWMKNSRRDTRKRQLRLEQFEKRSMMASDLCFHNIETPEDTDGSGDVTPLDALVIINQLNNPTATSNSVMTDVDADATTSPLDALVVINFLNRGDSNDNSSAVSTSSRIARIEQAISNSTLASKFTLDDAIEILATLRSGGRPELGQRFPRPEDHSGDDTNRSERFLEKLTSRLTDAGVDSEVIDTITTEITTAIESGTPLTLEQIKSRLTELGVDVTAIFPQKPEQPGSTDRFVEKLTQKLTDAGVATETIETITTEIEEAVAAGAPLTWTQIKDRLTELGVDVDELFPSKPEHPVRTPSGGLIDRLTNQLTDAGVDTTIIETITQEIRDAEESGDPMSLREIKSRLTELGVDTSALDLAPPPPHRHRRHR